VNVFAEGPGQSAGGKRGSRSKGTGTYVVISKSKLQSWVTIRILMTTGIWICKACEAMILSKA
jgi:hypothetical protein